jgi:hypothetical protein
VFHERFADGGVIVCRPPRTGLGSRSR